MASRDEAGVPMSGKGPVPINLRAHAEALIPLVAKAIDDAQKHHVDVIAPNRSLTLAQALSMDAKVVLGRLDEVGALVTSKSEPDLDYEAWLTFGVEKGWISMPVCATHSMFPWTPEEEEAWNDGSDPCQFAVRLWGEGGPASEG